MVEAPPLDATAERLERLQSALDHAVDDTRQFVRTRFVRSALSVDLAAAARDADDVRAVLAASRRARARTYYKAVAVVGGRYLSIFDGVTEFRIGERCTRTYCHARRGAFFVYDEPEKAFAAEFPAKSKLLHAPRAVLRVRSANYVRPTLPPARGHGDKLMLWELTPTGALPPPHGPEADARRKGWR